MSKRPPPSHSTDRHPSGLIKTLESLGRTRGSSATPAPSGPSVVSPTPNRGFRAQLDNMNNMSNALRHTSLSQSNPNRDMNSLPRRGWSGQNQRAAVHTRNPSSSTRSASSNQDQGVGVHCRNLSSSTHQSGSTQDQGVNNSALGSLQFGNPQNQGPGQGITPQMTVGQRSVQFQTKLTELQQVIARTPGIPKHLQDFLNQELRRIGQEFNEQQRRLQQDFDKAKIERHGIQTQIEDLRQRLRAVKQDLDRVSEERDDLQQTANELRLKHKRSMERVNEIEERWKRINDSLLDQISMQEEQLKGKRALWLEANPTSSARRAAMTAIRDPFDSPSASHTPSFTGGRMTSMASPSVGSPTPNSLGTAPQMQLNNAAGFNSGSRNRMGPRRRPNLPSNLPTGKAMPAGDLHSPWELSSNSHIFNTEPGDTPPSMALVLHQKEEDLAPAYRAAIAKLYALVEGWVKIYTHVPNQKNDRAIASTNDILWAYMMNCTYPGHRQDSHTHVVTLLNDQNTRHWFVMRMAITYCVKDIMSVDTFKPYGAAIEKIISEVQKKLQERGLNNEARQRYIDEQSKAVQSIVAAKNYQKFRAEQLNFHTKRLRDMLGPMLNDGVERAEAGKDLGAIAITAWELSVKMHTAHLTFQVYFPETAAKFTAATMNAKDKTEVSPMQLQIQQTRLKLVITPVITMRDDRGTTIKAKNLHTSNVLVMN